MAKRITGLGAATLKYFPILAVVLAIYQYYREAGGFAGFLADIKGFNMKVLEAKWTSMAMGIAFFVGADVVSRYVPGKMKHIVKAVMYYFGASQILAVLQGMYIQTEVQNKALTQGQGQTQAMYRGGAY